MLPTREEAMALIRDGLSNNPGPWGKHSLTAAHCAEKIAAACGGMDAEKAYVLGLLHDIGRKFGVRHLGHVYDGYVYMKSLGYDEVAKICLTHSFNNHVVNLIYMLSQHPYHHMHLLFFLHSVLLLNNVFPKVPDYLINHHESTPLLLLLLAT